MMFRLEIISFPWKKIVSFLVCKLFRSRCGSYFLGRPVVVSWTRMKLFLCSSKNNFGVV